MPRKIKHRSPSRIKYEQNHPTVSARLPMDKHEKLLEILGHLHMTLPQLLLSFIGEYEIKIKPLKEAKKEGYKLALDITKKQYRVSYPCGVCGKEILVSTEAEKKAIRKSMMEQGWRHSNCEAK